MNQGRGFPNPLNGGDTWNPLTPQRRSNNNVGSDNVSDQRESWKPLLGMYSDILQGPDHNNNGVFRHNVMLQDFTSTPSSLISSSLSSSSALRGLNRNIGGTTFNFDSGLYQQNLGDGQNINPGRYKVNSSSTEVNNNGGMYGGASSSCSNVMAPPPNRTSTPWSMLHRGSTTLPPKQNHLIARDYNLLQQLQGQKDGFPVTSPDPYRPIYNLNTPARPESGGGPAPYIIPVTPDQRSQEKVEQKNVNELQGLVNSSTTDNIPSLKENEEIDLNETPKQKTPRRRKHRPKVVREGKPKRTPKPKTEPKTPKDDTTSVGTSTGKRKYVRRKGINITTPDQTVKTSEVTKPVKRALHFDLEKEHQKSVEKKTFNLNLAFQEPESSGINKEKQMVNYTPSMNTSSSATANNRTLNVIARNLSMRYQNRDIIGDRNLDKTRQILQHSSNDVTNIGSKRAFDQTSVLPHAQNGSRLLGIYTEDGRFIDSSSLGIDGLETCKKTKVSDLLDRCCIPGSSRKIETGLYTPESTSKKLISSAAYQIPGQTHVSPIQKETFKGVQSQNSLALVNWNKPSLIETRTKPSLIEEEMMTSAKKKRRGPAKTKKPILSDDQKCSTSMTVSEKEKCFDLLSYVIEKLSGLNINHGKEKMEDEQTAIVPYKVDGSIVPFDADSIKRRRPRPKVDLDPESNRLWNLLMGKEGTENMDKRTEKKWEEERNVFRGRIDSFIARMHLVQGDRRFSPWKGSVVDSVIGVFLTQNVSDHLSSSAFMSLAAKFPLPLSKQMSYWNGANPIVEEPEVEIIDPDGTITYHTRITRQPLYYRSSTTCSETSEVRVEDAIFGNKASPEKKNDEVISSHTSPDSILYQDIEEIRSNSDPESVLFQSPPSSNLYSKLMQETIDMKPEQQETIIHPSPESKALPKTQTGETSSSNKPVNEKKRKLDKEKPKPFDWDSLRKEVYTKNGRKERSKDTMDSLDYEVLRHTDVKKISDTIKERGMNNMLAERMKDFLNRLVEDHEEIDLEWLREVDPDKAKEYLLSIRGLGLKSVECIRLLELCNVAFPVDTNVGRIAVRLGWVPLQPLPESLQLHLLELYPVLESIQKYLWPRLCKLDQRTLYELHYQMITFGKVFCTKSKPNCNACPMRGECRHFASAFASARLSLPGPEEKGIVKSSGPIGVQEIHTETLIKPMGLLTPPETNGSHSSYNNNNNKEPIVDEPATPEQSMEITESDIEDAFYNDPEDDEIPTIKLNIEEFTSNLQSFMQEGDLSRAIVALSPQKPSIPTAKLKNVSRLRTEHHVYELPDTHPLLEGMDRREPDDPSPYLLAIWTPGETPNSIQQPESKCNYKGLGRLCDEVSCFPCNSIREANTQIVRGTILIPCRTAMRGSFPLNGTYFQVNEVFADHASSLKPIDVPRGIIWNLPRRTVYFGTSVTSIFKGLTTEGIQFCFWKGFICVRGFDQKTRAPRPLMARLHFPVSKMVKTKTDDNKKKTTPQKDTSAG